MAKTQSRHFVLPLYYSITYLSMTVYLKHAFYLGWKFEILNSTFSDHLLLPYWQELESQEVEAKCNFPSGKQDRQYKYAPRLAEEVIREGPRQRIKPVLGTAQCMSPYEPTRTTHKHDPATPGFHLTPNIVSELSAPHFLNHSSFKFVNAILSIGRGTTVSLYNYHILQHSPLRADNGMNHALEHQNVIILHYLTGFT